MHEFDGGFSSYCDCKVCLDVEIKELRTCRLAGLQFRHGRYRLVGYGVIGGNVVIGILDQKYQKYTLVN